MSKLATAPEIDRRRFLILAGIGGAVLAAGPYLVPTARADEAAAAKAIKAVIGGKKPEMGRVAIDLPEIAENGNTVPITVEVKSPMTEKDYVKAVHVFADGNPRPEVANFHFTPMSGVAKASTRMRLAKTQDVIAIAEMSDGSLFMGKRLVKVTIGGCGG